MVFKNRQLSEENLTTRRELAMYKHAEGELSKRNHAYLMTIQSLLSKLRALEGASAELSKSRTSSDDIITSAYRTKVTALQDAVEDTLKMLDGMRNDLEVKTTEVARIRMEREELGFLVLQAAQEAKGHLTDTLYGQSIQEDDESMDEALRGRQGGPNFSQQIRLQDLKGAQRHQVLRYLVERVSDMHVEARKNILPDDRSDTRNVLFPKIDRKPVARSLTGRGSVDTERHRVKTGADHRSEGGRS